MAAAAPTFQVLPQTTTYGPPAFARSPAPFSLGGREGTRGAPTPGHGTIAEHLRVRAFTLTDDDHTDTGQFTTNGSVSYNVLCFPQREGEDLLGGGNQILFCERQKRDDSLQRHRVLSLSALNYHLRSAPMRKQYGEVERVDDPRSPAHWFQFFGVQKADGVPYNATDAAVTIAIVVQRRAMCHNIWLNRERATQNGSGLYLRWRRFEEQVAPLLGGAHTHFWQLVPLVCPPKHVPDDGPATNTRAIFVGTAHLPYGRVHGSIRDSQSHAVGDAVFPASLGPQQQQLLASLPLLEVVVRLRV